MVPYFFAAGHLNYVSYGLCYLITMSKLPPNILDKFLQGEHILCHKQGIWNGIWSHMIIETTFMQFGKGPLGNVVNTTNPRIIQIWAKSQHKCSEVLKNLDNLWNRDESNITNHKEANTARIKNHQVHRTKLKDFLIASIHPLQRESHILTNPCNIYTG